MSPSEREPVKFVLEGHFDGDDRLADVLAALEEIKDAAAGHATVDRFTATIPAGEVDLR